MTNDDIISLRDSLTALEQPSVTQQNVLRDCDIALRVVRCDARNVAEARARIERFMRDHGQAK